LQALFSLRLSVSLHLSISLTFSFLSSVAPSLLPVSLSLDRRWTTLTGFLSLAISDIFFLGACCFPNPPLDCESATGSASPPRALQCALRIKTGNPQPCSPNLSLGCIFCGTCILIAETPARLPRRAGAPDMKASTLPIASTRPRHVRRRTIVSSLPLDVKCVRIKTKKCLDARSSLFRGSPVFASHPHRDKVNFSKWA